MATIQMSAHVVVVDFRANKRPSDLSTGSKITRKTTKIPQKNKKNQKCRKVKMSVGQRQ